MDELTNYQAMRKLIMLDPSSSLWLQRAVRALDQRRDAERCLADVEMLLEVARARAEEGA